MSAPNWLHDKRVQIAVTVTQGKKTVHLKATPEWPRGSKITCLEAPKWSAHYDSAVGGDMALYHDKAIAKVAVEAGVFKAAGRRAYLPHPRALPPISES